MSISIKLAEAAHCEHQGSYGYESNHQVGRQIDDELRFIDYYNKPWKYVFRSTDLNVANAIAIRMEQAVRNTNIGYGQPTRKGYYEQIMKDPDPSHIKVKCDCDCSSLVNTNALISWICIGRNPPMSGLEVTANMPSVYKAPSMAPYFTDVTSTIDLASGKGLKRGDILVTPFEHTAVVVEYKEVTSAKVGTVTTDLYLRKGAGALYGAIAVMKKGSTVTILEDAKTLTGAKWYKVSYNNQVGYCSAKYIQ